MLGVAIELLIVVTTTNHVYKFENKFKFQADGRPIGPRCTGEMADCFMANWDKEFMKKLNQLEIELLLYSRFKDDINVVAECLEKG